MENTRKEFSSHPVIGGRWWTVPELTIDDFVVTVSKIIIGQNYRNWNGEVKIVVEPTKALRDEMVVACPDKDTLDEVCRGFTASGMVTNLTYRDSE